MVTNLQMRAKTIQVLAKFMKDSTTNSHFNVFIAWVDEFRDGNAPNENANVTTASLPETAVAAMYDYLLRQPQGLSESEDLDDFQTSIQSHRNTNPTLDELCTALETSYSSGYTFIKDEGRTLLLGT